MAKKVVSKKKVVAKKPLQKKAAPTAKSKDKVEKKSTPPKKVAVSKPTPAPSTMMKTPVVEKPVATKASKVKQVPDNTDKIKIDRDSMSDEQVKWAEMYNKYKDTQASSYDMKASFQAASPLLHKILGWGWIVSNENDRLEVLFKDGKRMLISNYRG